MGLRADDQKDPTTPDNCAALERLVDYDDKYGQGAVLLGRYNSANFFTTDLHELNVPFESIAGPVDIDWMLRSSLGGAGRSPEISNAAFYLMKPVWDTVWGLRNWIVDGTPLVNPFGYGDKGDKSYVNAPSAASAWLLSGMPLRALFAPALEQCRKKPKLKQCH
ncbi:MAG: hypothetical protein ACYC69_09170 [Thermodesulfovibrionales bacterium]